MKYIIGVDGGGTKTEAVGYDSNNNEIVYGYSGFGNLYIDFEKASNNISDSIQQCINKIKEIHKDAECSAIYLGIAGIEVGDNVKRIEKFITDKFGCKVMGLHDSVLAHAAVHKGGDGIITIAGTGSVCYGMYKGRNARTGGWGHILGDEGSAYHIALEAFKMITIEEDSGLVLSELSKAVLSKLGADKASDIKEFIYSAGKAEIASFAPIVTELAGTDEINAIKILERAGKELAIMTERLYRKLSIEGIIDIGIYGSVLNKSQIVRREFEKHLANAVGNNNMITEDFAATKGACFIHEKTVHPDLKVL